MSQNDKQQKILCLTGKGKYNRCIGRKMQSMCASLWKLLDHRKNKSSYWRWQISPKTVARHRHRHRTRLEPKICRKWSKNGKKNCQISSVFFLAERGSNVIRFQCWDQIWNPLIQAILSDPKMKEDGKLYCLAPYSISKSSINWRPSLHHTDRAQISHTVFWYYKATFETLIPCTFQKKCFSLHPNIHAKTCRKHRRQTQRQGGQKHVGVR